MIDLAPPCFLIKLPPMSTSSTIFTLRPYVSLSRSGFLIVMGFVSVVSFATGIFFATLGAWPVLGFYGLEVVLLYAAFRWTYFRARRCESIEITPERVSIVKISETGHQEKWQCHPYWLKLELSPPEHSAEEIGPLVMSSRGEYIRIGDFLAPEERQALYPELRSALAAAASGTAPPATTSTHV